MGTRFLKLSLPCIIIVMINMRYASAVDESRPNRPTYYYMCPPDFIRLGSSCYYFSVSEASWQDAYYQCKDRDSNLTSPQRWEDRNLRAYLNQPEIERNERWTGGLYDWEAKAWKWGGEMRTMRYQSFSRMPRLPPEKLKWHCVAMIPDLLYRWTPRSCIEKKLYICQTKLRKVRNSDRNKLRKKWNPNGNGNDPNEIPVPQISEYDSHNKNLDNELNPNSIYRTTKDLNNYNENIPETLRHNNSIGKNEYAYRKVNGTRIQRKKKKPFPGYKKFKGDPQATYIHNVNALKSGKIGLSSAEIDKHLLRLERLRKKEERARQKKERIRDQTNRDRNFLQGNQNYDSVIAPEVSNIRNRNVIDDKTYVKKHKPSLSFDNVTQKTYTMNNQLSALHPKTIVEVHDFIKSP